MDGWMHLMYRQLTIIDYGWRQREGFQVGVDSFFLNSSTSGLSALLKFVYQP